MKRFFLILVIFSFISVKLTSYTSWKLDIFSYTGGRSYLGYSNIFNHMRYTPLNLIKFKLNYNNESNFHLNTIIKNKKDVLDDVPIIYKLSATYKTSNWEIGFLKDYIGYGKNSYLFNTYLLSPYFDKYYFGNYNFFGLAFNKFFSDFSISFKLGGNEFNREILDLKFSYNFDKKNYITIFAQNIVKDNLYNKNLSSFGCALNIKREKYSISGIIINNYYKESKKTFSPQFFCESVFFPINYFNIGININYEKYQSGLPEKTNYHIFLTNKFNSISDRIILTHNIINKNKYNNEITLELNKSITSFKFGLITAYGISFENNKYLELGITVSVNYEKN